MEGKKLQRNTEDLERENDLLRAELWEQWLDNHSEHCGGWPHSDGRLCCWPLPGVLRITLSSEALQLRSEAGDRCD